MRFNDANGFSQTRSSWYIHSDLNINAFCLNFRTADGKINEDVEEANFLNNAVYRALSIIDRPVEVVKLPMFISATTFEMGTYGECCTHYKERLGLETKSKQDLFVLRNVVSFLAYCLSFETLGKPYPSSPDRSRRLCHPSKVLGTLWVKLLGSSVEL